MPVSGAPDTGGTTNTGYQGAMELSGQYAFASSPWGLLDASGGTQEWTDTSSAPGRKLSMGRTFWMDDSFISNYDRIDADRIYLSPLSVGGFRVMSVIPHPGTVSVAVVYLLIARRRRSC